MTNVKTLPGVKLQDDGPVENVVSVLEKLLDLARSGHLRSLIAVGTNQNQVIDAVAMGEANPYVLVGALGVLTAKVNLTTIESEEYEPS